MNEHAQIYLPRLTLVNKIIILISSVLFTLDFFVHGLSGYLGLSAASLFGGNIFSLVTYPLLSHSLMEVILNCLMLWLMGSEFEENWGRSRYLKFLGSVVIGGGLVYVLISFLFFKSSLVFSYPLSGLSGIVSALCVAYAVIFPTRIFSFLMIIPIQAKYFCLILAAIALFQGFSGPAGAGAWGQLGAIASGFLFMHLVSRQKVQKTRPKSKAKLTIVQDPVKDNEETPPKYWH
jgi:membrane associated rhomboid family serine protease